MKRLAVVALAAFTLVGCHADAEVGNKTSNGAISSSNQEAPKVTKTEDSTRLAAMAGGLRYPANWRPVESRMTALVNKGDSIRILNPTDRSIGSAFVWVNHNYVYRIAGIPANGSLDIPLTNFYNSTGDALSRSEESVKEIEIQEGDSLVKVNGPIVE